MSNTPNSPAREAAELPEPHVLSGHYRDHTDTINGYSEAQVRALLAAKQEELDKMREALVLVMNYPEIRSYLGSIICAKVDTALSPSQQGAPR